MLKRIDLFWVWIGFLALVIAAGLYSAFLGFTQGFLGPKESQPLARIAVFIGVLGYSGALMALILDIGRPDRFWHGWVFWNIHSMLWEVTMCIPLYLTVLT